MVGRQSPYQLQAPAPFGEVRIIGGFVQRTAAGGQQVQAPRPTCVKVSFSTGWASTTGGLRQPTFAGTGVGFEAASRLLAVRSEQGRVLALQQNPQTRLSDSALERAACPCSAGVRQPALVFSTPRSSPPPSLKPLPAAAQDTQLACTEAPKTMV
jgi:hypothetical protein